MAQARQEIEGTKAVELKAIQPPVHPVPVLQGPFEESIIESDNRPQDEGLNEMDAQSRRDQLLQGKEYIRICGGTWRQMSHERQDLRRNRSNLQEANERCCSGITRFGSLLLRYRLACISWRRDWRSRKWML